MSNVKVKWTDFLSNDVYDRLVNCKSRKSDILPIAQAKWNVFKNAPNPVLDKEDALVTALDILDMNGNYIDLTKDEYGHILSQII